MHRRTVARLVISAVGLCALPGTVFAAEGRTPVWAYPTIIGAPGRYIVTRDITGGGAAPVINITVGDVDLDLNGMTLNNAGSAAAVVAVTGAGVGDVVIHDGTLLDGGENVSVSAAGARLVLEDLKIADSSGAAIHIVDNMNFVVRRVTISGAGAEGILVDGPINKQGTIVDNLVRRTQGTGIRVFTGFGVGILNNRVEETLPGTQGIALDQCDGCLVLENTVASAGDVGIFLRGFRGGKVYNNVVSKSASHGIFLDSFSIDGLILNNVVNGSGAGGAGGHGLLVDGDRFMIEGNTLNSNAGAGLRLGPASSLLTFGRNTARGNTGVGAAPCAGAPALTPPNSCNDGAGNTSFGTNLIPGPPLS